jgi:hypothetical protein
MWGTPDFSVCSLRRLAVWKMIYINDFNRGLLAAGESEAWRSPPTHIDLPPEDRPCDAQLLLQRCCLLP